MQNTKTLTPLFLDFETFYDVGYSLASPTMAMSEYVRDEKFKAHMVQWRLGVDGTTHWCSTESIQAVLDEFDWSTIELVAHNTAFDGFVLSDRYGKVPARYADTMLMSRAVWGANISHGLEDVATRLNIPGKVKGTLESTKGIVDLPPDLFEKLAEYGMQDVEICAQAYLLLKPHVPEEELDLIDITLRMFCDPVLYIDRDRVKKELEHELGKRNAQLLMSGVKIETLTSNEKFADALRSRKVEPPVKYSTAKTKKGQLTYAFSKKDPEFLKLLKHEDPVVRAMAEARMTIRSSIGITRSERFLDASNNGKKLPVLLNYCGAHTTRWSAGNKMNMQNLPQGGELRKSILAPPGYVICTGDSSQIEARTNLWFADDQPKLQIFRDYDAKVGPDLYRVQASSIYDIPIEQINDDQRFVGKTAVLGLGYGLGAAKLQASLETDKRKPMKLSYQECSRIVEIYREDNKAIMKLHEYLEQALTFMITGDKWEYKSLRFDGNAVILPNGLPIVYDGLTGVWNGWSKRFYNVTYKSRKGETKIYGGMFDENLCQGMARVIVADQMREIAKRYRIVMMTHDEISWLVPEAEADEGLAWGLAIMRTPPAWAPDLPINAEGKYATYYCK